MMNSFRFDRPLKTIQTSSLDKSTYFKKKKRVKLWHENRNESEKRFQRKRRNLEYEKLLSPILQRSSIPWEIWTRFSDWQLLGKRGCKGLAMVVFTGWMNAAVGYKPLVYVEKIKIMRDRVVSRHWTRSRDLQGKIEGMGGWVDTAASEKGQNYSRVSYDRNQQRGLVCMYILVHRLIFS